MTRINPLSWVSASLAVGVVVGLVVAGAVYGLAARGDAPSTTNATVGPEERTWIPEGETANRTFSWSTRLTLDAEPDAYRLVVQLPYAIEEAPESADGSGLTVGIDVDGREILAYRLYEGDGGVAGVLSPDPGFEDAFEEGPNRVHASVTVHRSADQEGGNRVEVGPLIVEAHPHDADRDGIPDPSQPVQGVHTGLLAGLVGAAAGAPSGLAARSRLSDSTDGGDRK